MASAATQKKIRSEIYRARLLWTELPKPLEAELATIIHVHSLSVSSGDVMLLNGKWYVTSSGLLRVARRNRCAV